MKSRDDCACQFQHDRVNHQPEQAERKNCQRERYDFQKNPSVALMKPITSAAISAATGPLTLMPGTIRETIQTARALSAQLKVVASGNPPD